MNSDSTNEFIWLPQAADSAITKLSRRKFGRKKKKKSLSDDEKEANEVTYLIVCENKANR